MTRHGRTTSPASLLIAQAFNPDRMACVAVADEVWADFRALVEPETISVAVEREVDRHRARA